MQAQEGELIVMLVSLLLLHNFLLRFTFPINNFVYHLHTHSQPVNLLTLLCLRGFVNLDIKTGPLYKDDGWREDKL